MSYVTGNIIRRLREERGITQKELAEIISVSDKTISKWETNRGLPDIGVIEELAKALRVSLPKQESESADESHLLLVETIDDEYSVTMQHPMNKEHYVSFIAYITSGSAEIIKLYPEQDISVRFRKKGHGILYAYCNRHGLFRKYI